MADELQNDPAETRRVTTATGDSLAYDVRGDGPVLVFVAGAGPYRAVDPTTTETADRVAERGVRAVTFDRLGRGESAADGILGLDREVDAIRALIDAVDGHAVLCGHSSGCSIALKAAADGLPIDGLALWETPLGQIADSAAWADEVGRRIDAGDYTGAVEHYMKDMPPEWLTGMKSSPAFEQMARAVISQRADAESVAWADDALTSGGLATITVPVLTMSGTTSMPGMPVAAAAIAAAVPHGTAVTVAGANHTWEPAPMARVLADFVLSNAR